MKSVSPLAMLAGLAAIVLGLPIGLYVLLTRGQRRTTREIRSAAVRQGWRYRRRRWQGNPTAFRIDGRTPGGLPWVMTSGNSRGDDRGWSVQLAMRFPSLGGDTDLAVLPRRGRGPAIPPNSESRVAAFSGAFAGAAAFLRDARDVPSGVPEFDGGYRILVSPRLIGQPLLEPAFTQCLLHWPAGVIVPHSFVAWRDFWAFEFQARLPAPPNWATVSEFAALGGELAARVPPPMKSAVPRGFIDRVVGRCRR